MMAPVSWNENQYKNAIINIEKSDLCVCTYTYPYAYTYNSKILSTFYIGQCVFNSHEAGLAYSFTTNFFSSIFYQYSSLFCKTAD